MAQMDATQLEQLLWFASLSREDAQLWIAERQEELRIRAVAECDANGAHVLQMNARACPRCDTPYDVALAACEGE